MKKTLILLALIITTFAIAKNTDDSHKKSLVKPNPPKFFRLKTQVNQYWNLSTFAWDAPAAGVSYAGFKIYMKRINAPANQGFVAPQTQSIIGLEYSFTDAEMPMPMNYELYVVAFDVNGIESDQSNHIYYAQNDNLSPQVPSLTTDNVYNATTQGFSVDCGNSTSSNIIGYFFYANNIPVGFSGTSIYTIEGLNPNKPYNITVSALNMYGNVSAPSAPITKTTLDYSAPPNGGENSPSYDSNNYIKQLQIGYNNYKYPSVPRNSPAQPSPLNYIDFKAVSDVGSPKLIIGEQEKDLNNNKLVVRVANKSLWNASVIVGVDFDYNGIFEGSEITIIGNMNFQNNGLPNIANMNSNGTIKDGIPLDFCSTIVIPSYAYIGTVKMRIMYSRYRRTEITSQFLLNNHTSSNLADFLAQSNEPTTIPIGEIEDFNVELVRPATTTTARNAITSKNTISEEKNSISEKSNVTDFVLYPNPVTGDVMNISLIEDNTPYRLINMLGQEIGAGQVENGTISVAKLSQGTYTIELIQNENRIVKRFIKQ
jgi:Secretion system C-terminal sorting domain